MIPELQPRTAVQFQTTIEGTGSPELRFDSAKDTVKLMKIGVVSFSVEHEAEILIYLACALGMLLLIYLYYLAKHP